MADARATLEDMLAMGNGEDSVSDFLKSSFEQLGLGGVLSFYLESSQLSSQSNHDQIRRVYDMLGPVSYDVRRQTPSQNRRPVTLSPKP